MSPNKRQMIVRMKYGSHLYGTNTPTSDVDYKGVYLPSRREILTCRVARTEKYASGPEHQKNSPTDVDDDSYSLPYFLHLASQGETVALDMLHAPHSAIELSSPTWDALVLNRSRFYTKSMRAFVGYAKRQAAKYGIKGSRLAAAKKALERLMVYPGKTIAEIWDELWEDEYCKKVIGGKFYEHSTALPPVVASSYWEVCGKKMTAFSKCHHYIPMMTQFVQNYGDRAKQAEKNEGIDWKAISHAFRAGYQVQRILEDGTFTYPLPETDFLIAVKTGKLDYLTCVAPQLESLMDRLEELSAESTLPNKVDLEWVDGFLEETLWEYLCASYIKAESVNESREVRLDTWNQLRPMAE